METKDDKRPSGMLGLVLLGAAVWVLLLVAGLVGISALPVLLVLVGIRVAACAWERRQDEAPEEALRVAAALVGPAGGLLGLGSVGWVWFWIVIDFGPPLNPALVPFASAALGLFGAIVVVPWPRLGRLLLLVAAIGLASALALLGEFGALIAGALAATLIRIALPAALLRTAAGLAFLGTPRESRQDQASAVVGRAA